MSHDENATTGQGDRVVCLHSRADTDTNATISARIQALLHLGLTLDRAVLLSSLAFGEGLNRG